MSSYQRRTTAARSFAVFLRQAGSARSAASIAARVSAAPHLGTVPMISAVAGLSTLIVAPDRASVHAPSMSLAVRNNFESVRETPVGTMDGVAMTYLIGAA